MKKLYEVLVPTIYGDTKKPIRTRHHKNWDAFVRKISGGLTLLVPGKGQWVFENELYEERVIPVRILCAEKQIKEIVQFTLEHYRQIAVMYYVVSNDCYIVYKNNRCIFNIMYNMFFPIIKDIGINIYIFFKYLCIFIYSR